MRSGFYGVACVLVWLLLSGLQPLWAQATFEAYADAKEVVRNSYFELTFTLKNAQASNFKPPSFSDFEVLSGPSRAFRTSIVNGNVSQETSYVYELQPRRTGTLQIGSAQIDVDGKTLRTKPLSIRVVQGKVTEGGDEVMVRAQISSREAYLGQQLVLDYILSSRVDYRGLTAVAESEYDGFYSRPVQQFDTRVQREVIDGVQYSSRIVKRMVLYPQETGTLTIDPLTVALGIVVEGQRRSGGFFATVPTKKVTLSTAAMDIKVLPLPQPQPANFSGISGSYELRSEVTKNSLTTDDAVSVYIAIEGSGDLKRVQAPALNFPAAFEVYEPNLKEEEYYDLPSQVKGRKVFEYVLVPREAGEFTIRPELIVFNPDSVVYTKLSASPLRLSVKQGTGEANSGLVVDGEQRQDLHGPRADVALQEGRDYFFGSPIYWGVYALPLLLALGFGGLHWRKQQQPEVDPVMLRQQGARQLALKRLAEAKTYHEAQQSKAFYDEIEAALLGYLSDKVQIPRADLSKKNIKAKLDELGLPDGLTEEFLQLLQRCEMALYAGMDNTAATEETYERALKLLEGMESGLDK